MVELHEADGIAEIRLDKPPVNALDRADIARLAEIVTSLDGDPSTRAVVFRGTGRAFCGGADITYLGDLRAGRSDDSIRDLAASMQDVYLQIEEFAVPTIAVLHGATVGAGLELALACDFRVASTTARLGVPEAHIGLIPAAGGTQRLTRTVGRAVALEMVMLGRLVSGERAAEIGLVQWLEDPEDLESRVEALLDTLATVSSEVISSIKACINSAPTAYDVELEEIRRLEKSNDTWERIAAFLGEE